MKTKSLIATALLSAGMFAACDDDVSGIGSSLTEGEVTITVDSLVMALDSKSVYSESIDGRNATKLLGRINVPEYGSLNCSFVTQMMSASSLSVPDSITVDDIDSVRLMLTVPRGSLTGDSLAPQQLRAYRLDRQLPVDITSSFNPEGYYDSSAPMGQTSYTLSVIAKGDSAVKHDSYVRVPVMLPIEFGRQIFTKYREDPSVFQWPETFNQYFPGFYVEQNFGNGCVANISNTEVMTYWHRIDRRYEMQPDSTYEYVDHIVRDSVCLMGYQPEVLSSNIIRYSVSDYIKGMADTGKTVVTTPGGYHAELFFPVQKLLDAYRAAGNKMSIVSSLRMEIPATAVVNNYGLTAAPYLLMVKKNEVDDFFKNNRIPDGKTSFYAAYDSDAGRYRFNAMRSYFLDVLENVEDGGSVKDEDCEFVLIPVDVQTESVQSYQTTTIYVTRCQPYLAKPTITELDMDRVVICFTYSAQDLD